MLFYNMRYYNYIFSVFGFRKPYPTSGEERRMLTISILQRIWAVALTAVFLALNYCVPFTGIYETSLSKTIDFVHNTNEVTCSLLVVFIRLVNSDKAYIELYTLVKNILVDLKINDGSQKLFSMKLNCMVFVPFFIGLFNYVFVGIWLGRGVLLFRTYIIIEGFHLSIMMGLLAGLAGVLNDALSRRLKLPTSRNIHETKPVTNKKWYLVKPETYFIDCGNENEYFSLALLCRTYDSLGSCVRLLEKQHGVQTITAVWLVFSGNVIELSALASETHDSIAISILQVVSPLYWIAMTSFLDDQMRQAAEKTDLLIMKHLIDFRCDPATRSTLEIFRQLVAANCLRYKPFALFHLNYSTLLAIVVSIITYTIIALQIFTD